MTDLATRAPIDPRIADRREEVERDRRRRLFRRLGILGVVLAVVAIGVGLTRSPLLDVDHITVEGARRTGADAVVAAAPVHLGDAMLHVDLGAVRDAVAELPWVASVAVERQWPATVRVVVTERVPVAVVDAGEAGWQVVDAEGRVLAVEAERPAGLLELEGPTPVGVGERVDGADDLLVVAAAVPPELAERVSGVAFGRSGDLVLDIDPAGRIRIGDTSDLEAKLAAAVTLFEQVDDRCIALMDVRVPAVPTIERDPACAAPAAPDPEEAVVGTDSAPVETAPVETAPVDSVPVETAPVETAPVETAPVETVPSSGGAVG